MRRINYFAMSLLASAALAFTGCSSEDVIEGGTSKNETGNFYMTLTIDASSASNGTRTAQQPEHEKLGSTAESNVKSGTFLVYDNDGNLKYTKTMSQAEWDKAQYPTQDGTTNTTGKKTLKISVTNVNAGTTYRIYFLANLAASGNGFNPFSHTYTAEGENFAGTYSTEDEFVMFNQNDPTTHADKYTVTFTEANKDENTPASVGTPIKIERVVARIDKPTATEAKEIKDAEGDNEAVKAEKDKIASISLQSYALANLAKETYLMQHWNSDETFFTPITTPSATNYFQTTDKFGGPTENTAGEGWFSMKDKNYVFENTVADDTYATKMYFVFKATWATTSETTPDFADGTFYRFEGKLYRSLQTIINEFESNGQANPFGIGVTKDALVTELGIDTNGNLTQDESKIKAFREKYQIEVFERGEMYYSTPIQDQFYTKGGYNILRNSIYQINVKNVYQIGTDVPNGTPSEVKPFYYLDVEVTVNPWVLNTINVDL